MTSLKGEPTDGEEHLSDELPQLAQRMDPVPPKVVAAARAAFESRPKDAARDDETTHEGPAT